jgi:uncharacterized short protein YbdD (DUF466 family)
MTDHYEIVHHERFQHYKDRSPPWIKLHASTLDDYAFLRLTDAQKWHLVGLWILASKLENALPNDEAWLAQKIGAQSEFAMQPLVDAGFVVLAKRKHNARRLQAKCSPRRDRGETEGETEVYSEHFLLAWDRYPRRPNNNKADAWAAWSARLKDGEQAERMLAGVEAYAGYVAAMKIEPKFVKQAKTFFGPKRPYLDDYTVAPPKPAEDFYAKRGYAPRKVG